LCCAVKGKVCIQNCGAVDDNVDQHYKTFIKIAQLKEKKNHTKNPETKYLLVNAVKKV